MKGFPILCDQTTDLRCPGEGLGDTILMLGRCVTLRVILCCWAVKRNSYHEIESGSGGDLGWPL